MNYQFLFVICETCVDSTPKKDGWTVHGKDETKPERTSLPGIEVKQQQNENKHVEWTVHPTVHHPTKVRSTPHKTHTKKRQTKPFRDYATTFTRTRGQANKWTVQRVHRTQDTKNTQAPHPLNRITRTFQNNQIIIIHS